MDVLGPSSVSSILQWILHNFAILPWIKCGYKILGIFRFLSFFLDFSLQMLDTKLQPTSKDSAMRTPQIAIPT